MKKYFYTAIAGVLLITLTGCNTKYSHTAIPTNNLWENLHEISKEELNDSGATITLSIKHPDKNSRIKETNAIINEANNNTIHAGEKLEQYIVKKIDGSDISSIYGLAKVEDQWIGLAGGDKTAVNDMPLSGVATYKGSAMGTLNKSTDDIGNEGFNGILNLEVNFGTGKIEGNIIGDTDYFGELGIDLSGSVVEGNLMQGTVLQKGDDGDGGTKTLDSGSFWGQFNGASADEVSGHYQSWKDNGMSGSFGGAMDNFEPEDP